MSQQLTNKELMLLEDNIKICQNMTKFLSGCSQMAKNPQIKQMCTQMASDHQQLSQSMINHLSSSTLQ